MHRKTPRKRTVIHRNAGSRCRCDKVRRYPLRADRARKGGFCPVRRGKRGPCSCGIRRLCHARRYRPAESSGGADDILDRDQTLFPDTVDQTAYPMEFEHTTPTSGTLTSSSAAGSAPSPVSRAFTMDLTLPQTRARPSPPSRTARYARPANPATACMSLSITRTVCNPIRALQQHFRQSR